jgi:LysM domain
MSLPIGRRPVGAGGASLVVVAVVVVAVVVVAVGVCAEPVALSAAPRSMSRKVGRGETAAKLAKRYYGKPWAARVLLLVNGLNGLAKQRPPELKVGSTIQMPTAWSYRIRPGDTFVRLARDYLGDGSKAKFLAWVNGKNERLPAPVGHVVIVPALVKVKLPVRMTLTQLAARLLNRKPRSEAVKRLVRRIRKYNGALAGSGGRSSLVVPLIRMRLLGWFLASGLPQSDPGTARRAEVLLRQANKHLRAGRYLEAAVGLAPVVRLNGLDSELRVRAHHLRCTAFVALARAGLALAAARSVLRLDPGFRLDPVRISPKVRAVYRRAISGGGGAGGKQGGN